MKLPSHKTKIVCTIGPASRSPAKLQAMIKSGMNVARLNFSHGDFSGHQKDIRNINKIADDLGLPVNIIIDLPGTKMRIGKLKTGSVLLKAGQKVRLTTQKAPGTASVIPVDYKGLAKSASKGSIIYLNDGFIQLKVQRVSGKDVLCKVIIGGNLLSHKGINLPGAKLFIERITRRDLECVDFGLRHGVTTFGLSFVEKASDITKVREFAKKRGKVVYLVAKIERREAIENFDEILKEADGIMVARGDLGVEIPLEEVPAIQKRLIAKANAMGRPVITATQMLESMLENIRPTRAEVNDVANAILDGTDAVMLSEETAIGEYPVDTVKIMAQIAAATERQREAGGVPNDEARQTQRMVAEGNLNITDVISLNVVRAVEKLKARYVLTPTTSGSTARRICRFKPPCWILAYSTRRETCGFLSFSYGVYPFLVKKKIRERAYVLLRALRRSGLAKKGDTVIITQRRLSDRPGETDSIGIATLE